MKKCISLFLALVMLLGILAVPAMAEEPLPKKVGVLAMLNIDEAQVANIMEARRILMEIAVRKRDGEGAADAEALAKLTFEPVYFDSLQEMQLALTAGKIDRMEIYQTTAKYICAQTDELVYMSNERLDLSDLAADILINGVLANDFTFLLKEGREALRDELNTAIAAIREDGTMEKLIAEYIDGAIEGKEIAPIEIAKIDEAETIKVGITGDLPPMDYIAPDGTPAGFNTALLAEISRRLGKNIKLVQMVSPARSSALATGAVDVVFWTRTSKSASRINGLSEDEQKEAVAKHEADVPESELAALRKADELIDKKAFETADLPAGTIISEPYFSDILVMVMTKAEADAR